MLQVRSFDPEGVAFVSIIMLKGMDWLIRFLYVLL